MLFACLVLYEKFSIKMSASSALSLLRLRLSENRDEKQRSLYGVWLQVDLISFSSAVAEWLSIKKRKVDISN